MATQNVQKKDCFVLRDNTKQQIKRVTGITITGVTKKEAKYVVKNSKSIVYSKR